MKWIETHRFNTLKFTNTTTKNLTPLNLSILGSKDLDFLSSFNTQEGMSGYTQTQYIYKYHYRPQLPIEPNFHRYTFGGKKQFMMQVHGFLIYVSFPNITFKQAKKY